MTHEARFLEFHAKNPHVYELFKQFVLEAYHAGRRKLSVTLIVERIRWEVMVSTTRIDRFKLNNNHSAFYARKFLADHPHLGPVFNTRTQRSI